MLPPTPTQLYLVKKYYTRLMLQRLMMGEEKLAQIFDPETNEKFKEMFYM